MNEQAINEQYRHIQALIVDRRLKEALVQLESFLWNCSDWNLRNHLEQLQTSYKYMLQYMRQGVEDPDRGKLHQKLITDTWGIADQARLSMLDSVSSHYYHEVRRIPADEYERSDLKYWMHILESFQDDLAVSGLLSDHKLNEVLMRHEKALKYMFLQTWTNSSWTVQDEEDAYAMLASELLPVHDLCLFVSAVTLSLMECFDIRKIFWLLDAYRQHSSVLVKQRALIGFIMTLYIYRNRTPFYPELIKKAEIYDEDYTLADDINSIYKQFLLCQETEKIDKKMREEIIPEMLKNVSSMRNMKFGFEESDEENDDKNPDWADALEKSGLGDKLREMNELQLEGADVYMSTFAALKGYPFFREIHNWFYPFDKQHSSVINVLKSEKEKNSVLELILNAGFFSNSDKYSLFFTIQQLPQAQRDMMLSQLSDQQMNEITELTKDQALLKHSERSASVSNQYLHDLYRFFKLNTRRYEFHDIFKDKLDLHHVPILDKILYEEKSMIPIAFFYFYKERWSEAIELFEEIESIGGMYRDPSPELYQKLGYALQKKKKYKEAIEAYQKADTIKPDNVWTNAHLASSYRLSRNYQEALQYYKKVEEVNPENRTYIFYIASCLAELEQYEEALNYFFKLDFLESNSVKAWRGIGWCSFVIRKHEQAMKYYKKIIERKPLPVDYMNAGHVAWVMGDLEEAVSLYEKAILSNGNKEYFLEMFRKDVENLIKQGISQEDIPLMLDLL